MGEGRKIAVIARDRRHRRDRKAKLTTEARRTAKIRRSDHRRGCTLFVRVTSGLESYNSFGILIEVQGEGWGRKIAVIADIARDRKGKSSPRMNTDDTDQRQSGWGDLG